MAGYHLYLRDDTYLKILQAAAKEGLTFGKKVNMILNDYVNNDNNVNKKSLTCEICGAKPYYETILQNGKKGLRCRFHKPERYFPGYREIGESVNAEL